MEREEWRFERLSDSIEICVSPAHRFGADAFLLADFTENVRGQTVCDLCSGCGIVAGLLLRRCGQGPRVVHALEIQPEAVEQMEQSVMRSALQQRLVAHLGDLKDTGAAGLPSAVFDTVTCNPPYKAADTGILSAAARDALARHEVACTLWDVCAAAARLLRFGGRLCLCQRPERLADVMEAMRRAGLEPKRLRFVQKRADTAPWLLLAEGRKGGKPFLRVLPPLLMQGAGEEPSPEIQRIYQLDRFEV